MHGDSIFIGLNAVISPAYEMQFDHSALDIFLENKILTNLLKYAT